MNFIFSGLGWTWIFQVHSHAFFVVMVQSTHNYHQPHLFYYVCTHAHAHLVIHPLKRNSIFLLCIINPKKKSDFGTGIAWRKELIWHPDSLKEKLVHYFPNDLPDNLRLKVKEGKVLRARFFKFMTCRLRTHHLKTVPISSILGVRGNLSRKRMTLYHLWRGRVLVSSTRRKQFEEVDITLET